jgi:hypothetical protein
MLGKLNMREEQHQFLALFGQPPARLTVEHAASGEQASGPMRQRELPDGPKIKAATGGAPTMTTNITDKRGYAQRWQFSPRHVDNLLARGLPHLKIGKRRVRILIDEADSWMRQTYGTQRRGPASGRKVLAAA